MKNTKITIGTKVAANWGAGYPPQEGEIIGWDQNTGWLIQWEREGGQSSATTIRTERSANGSPIGVWELNAFIANV